MKTTVLLRDNEELKLAINRSGTAFRVEVIGRLETLDELKSELENDSRVACVPLGEIVTIRARKAGLGAEALLLVAEQAAGNIGFRGDSYWGD